MSYPNDPIPMQKTSSSVSEAAQEAWNTSKQKATDVLDRGQRYVRQQPVPSVLSVFGFGLLLGVLVGYSIGRSHEDDYQTVAKRIARDLRGKLDL